MSMDKIELTEFAEKILNNWIDYSHERIDLETYTLNYKELLENYTKKEVDAN